MTKPLIALSMGDYNGIGPEVILKTVRLIDRSRSTPVAIGHETVFRHYNRLLQRDLKIRVVASPEEATEMSDNDSLAVINCCDQSEISLQPGRMDAETGKCAMEAVDMGIRFCLNGRCTALVTAPISKEAIALAGYPHPGHTEFLAEKTGSSNYQMILVSGKLRVALATIHLPLSQVCSHLTRDLLDEQLTLLGKTLQKQFRIERPTIAVLGLNPHAGDGGVLGREEIEFIRPAVEAASTDTIRIEGPLAADGFFGNRGWERVDAILAMYHDQGLIPFKTLSFGSGVNFTAGLPIIRTSPDHGTGFDIAGSNTASEASFRSAYELAVELAALKQEVS